MKIEQILQQQYKDFLETRSMQFNKPEDDITTETNKRLLFLVDHILDLTTYCEEYSIRIGTTLLDILKWLTRNKKLSIKSNYDYTATEELEFTYCLYVQYIESWLNWGTNIYTAWLDKIRLATGYSEEQNTIYTEFELDTNIIYFINFIDNKV